MSQVHRKSTKWGRLGLCDDILALVDQAGFKEPTEIQEQTIPVVLKGRDLIGSARTGSGKTASFALPMIESLIGRKGTYGLILSPTREIALQTQEAIRIFGSPLGVNAVALIGGTDVKADEEALGSGPQILVGTPGRICDHLERGNLWLEFIEMLVLDEADRMLDMGFSKEVNRIVNELPKNRQTLLFSATMAPDVETLARKILHNPERIAVGKSLTPPVTVEQQIVWVDEVRKKRELLRAIEREKGIILIFVSTKDGATRLWRSIHAAGVEDSTYISSNKTQQYREEALQGFKDGKYRVMVATDVAGRGIHVDNVALVINYDLPREPEDYIHRIGRTGRQENKGRALTFATPKDRKFIAAIQKMQGGMIREGESGGGRGVAPAARTREPERRDARPRAASHDRGHRDRDDRPRDDRPRHREPEPRHRDEPRHRETSARHRDEPRHREASSRHREEPRHRDSASTRHREEPRHRSDSDRHARPHADSRPHRESRSHRDEEPRRREPSRDREPAPRGGHRSEHRSEHRSAPRSESRDSSRRHREPEPRLHPDAVRPRTTHRDEPRGRREENPHRSTRSHREEELGRREPAREPRHRDDRDHDRDRDRAPVRSHARSDRDRDADRDHHRAPSRDRHSERDREPRSRDEGREYTRLETEFPRDREYRNPREVDRERDRDREPRETRAPERSRSERPERAHSARDERPRRDDEPAPRRSRRGGARRGHGDSRRETRH